MYSSANRSISGPELLIDLRGKDAAFAIPPAAVALDVILFPEQRTARGNSQARAGAASKQR
jgi:hypothetical protein